MNYQERKEAAQKFAADSVATYGVGIFEQAKVMLMTHGLTNWRNTSWVEETKQHFCNKDETGAIISNAHMLQIIACAVELATWVTAPTRTVWELQVLCYPNSANNR